MTIRTDVLNDYIEKKVAVILQLYENTDERTYNLIRNFLFQFLILKSYRTFRYRQDDHIKIFIEVSSDYINFEEDFKILKLY